MVGVSLYNLIEVENSKCFATLSDGFEKNEWQDLSKLAEQSNNTLLNMDTTIKAFSTKKLEDNKGDEEDEKKDANSSNFEEATCQVTGGKIYIFTDDFEKSYITMNIEVNDIKRNMKNDSYEYYYYLSAEATENDIEDWVLIKEEQKEANKLTFTVNTKDMANYEKLSVAEDIYLYIKEIVRTGQKEAEIISEPMLLEPTDITPEYYIDNEKVNPEDFKGSLENFENPNVTQQEKGEKDDTIASTNLPKAGQRTIIMAIITAVILGGIIFVRYKNLSKYIK